MDRSRQGEPIERQDTFALRDAWPLDPMVTMLNHGSFGSCPVAVLRRQDELRAQLEREPVQFFVREMQPLLDESRESLAHLIGCDAADLVFVSNATAGVNSVLRSLRFRPDEQILVTDHGYNACRNVAAHVAERDGAEVVVAPLPLVVDDPRQIVDAVLAWVTKRTRIALVDHVTSPTALVLPIEELVRELNGRGVDTLVDGAHAPGMVPVGIARIGAAYYTGNCHKWLCAPKGAGFLYVRPDRQAGLEPNIISHGFNTSRPGRSRFHDKFDWTGTMDYSPWLSVGEAIRFIGTLVEGGFEGLMRRNHELAVAARRLICRRLGVMPVGKEEMLGAMATFHLPDDADPAAALDHTTTPGPSHRLGRALWEQYRIEVPVFHFPAAPKKMLRISAQAYNSLEQYEYLADTLAKLL
jgi:isopenicillin-N epimerase